MKAVTMYKYGAPEVLQIETVDIPKIKDDEVLVEMHYAAVSSGDIRVRSLQAPFPVNFIMRLVFGLKGPRYVIPGVGGSGVIVEVGKDVTTFNVGDKVHSINGMRARHYAEYMAFKEKGCITKIPLHADTKHSAPLSFGALTAYHFTNKKNIKKDNEVLIYGASGAVGTYAIQLAKHYGANVTAVCSSKNHEIVTTLGADHVIDYHQNDFRKLSKKYDVIFDAVGKVTKKSCKKVFKPSSIYLSVKSMTSEKKQLLEEVTDIASKGALKTYIDKEFNITEIIEAHHYVETGHKVGNVVIKIK